MANVEYLGFLATLLVVASFLFQNIVLIRGVNALGAAVWIAYGVLIGSLPVVALNAVVICIQLVQMLRVRKKEDPIPDGRAFKVPVLKQ
jgi:uncharacterized protein with PQ loop repeat